MFRARVLALFSRGVVHAYPPLPPHPAKLHAQIKVRQGRNSIQILIKESTKGI